MCCPGKYPALETKCWQNGAVSVKLGFKQTDSTLSARIAANGRLCYELCPVQTLPTEYRENNWPWFYHPYIILLQCNDNYYTIKL